jgi:DNA topoisomerase-1
MAVAIAPSPPPDDPVAAARSAGLRYVTDAMPGLRRRRAGRGFVYLSDGGTRITDPEEIARIRALAIPPAWTEVWICPDENGHLQATGRDVRGRKQYRYHRRWREVRDETKYAQLVAFGRTLPAIRRRVARDMARKGLPREKVLATIVWLLERTLIRIGNDEYARDNESFGLTTMQNRHVRVNDAELRFRFRSKSGRECDLGVEHRRVARIVKRCRDLPGQQLFRYVDGEGDVNDVGSVDVNEYLRDISGRDLTAKHFRTWFGTVLAAEALLRAGPARSKRQSARKVNEAVSCVAAVLSNTTAVCRKAYIHPVLIDAYTDGSLFEAASAPARRMAGLRSAEAQLLAILRRLERNHTRWRAA